ncbi:hypothetical protein Trydic_g23443 [Trypoxylus dichotomus]
MECTSIEIFKEDGFPLNICNGCLEKLKSAYNFKEMVLQSNIELHQCLQKITEEKRETLIKQEHIAVENNLFDVSSEICTSNQPFVSIDHNNLNSSGTAHNVMEEKTEVLIKKENYVVGNNLAEVSTSYQPFSSVDCSNLNFSEARCNGVALKQDNIKGVTNSNCETSMAFENENKKLDLESTDDTKCISLIKTTDSSINHEATENDNQSRMEVTKKLKIDLNEKGKSHSLQHNNEYNKTLMLRNSLGRCPDTRPGNLPFKCKECDRRFAKKILLQMHISRHNLIARHPCDECGKMFRYRCHLKMHKVIHKTEQPYKCDVCNKTFKILKGLRLHQKAHIEREAKYVCETCNRAFTKVMYLNNHKKIHVSPDRWKFICKTCGKSFRLQCYLTRHMKTHKSDRPYVCIYCGQSFGNKLGLKSHVLIHTKTFR